MCKGDWAFQLTGMNFPSETCFSKPQQDINCRKTPIIDVYVVPRDKLLRRLKPEHGPSSGDGRLTPSPTYNRLRVNWPDYQGRIYKRDRENQMGPPLNEKLEGY